MGASGNEQIISFTCTYDIKDIFSYTQIINNRSGIHVNNVNKEIESKIKILNRGKKEKLTFTKLFDSQGINVINFIIESKLTNMNFMFNNCTSLKEVNFSNIETDQVTEMREMFQKCNKLENLDLSNFNTNNVTDMSFMFNKCLKLKEIKSINNFNTINVTNMKAMFQECNELLYLDLSNFNTNNVIDMGWMFNECHKLKEIKGINNFNTNKVTKMNSMF